MTNRRNKISLGQIVAEVYQIRGGKAAAELADRHGRHNLAEKIRWGRFYAPSEPFTPQRAQARAAALKMLAS